MKVFIFIMFLSFANAVFDVDDFLAQQKDCNSSESRAEELFRHIASNYGSDDVINASQLTDYVIRLLVPVFNSSDKAAGAYTVDGHTSSLFNLEGGDIPINVTFYFKVCAEILDFVGAYRHRHRERELDDDAADCPSRGLVWGYGFAAVTSISLCSLVGISFLPLMKMKHYEVILLFLITLAAGTLSSNAIFHLLPKAFGVKGDPATLWRSAVVFGGFYLFYLIKNVLERIFGASHSHAGADNHCDVIVSTTNHANGHLCNCEFTASPLSQPKDSTKIVVGVKDLESTELLVPSVKTSTRSDRKHSNSCLQQCWIFHNLKAIKTVAWMITIADGVHNFIDGLAIGASFSLSVLQGVSTSLAIFCEEFPHELGDFAILISSGMTIKQAAFYNFASACCCYAGMAVGVLVGRDQSSAQWVFAFAGGVFLYTSLSEILPEAQTQCSGAKLRKLPWACFVIKNLGLQAGFLVMFLLALYEDKIGPS